MATKDDLANFRKEMAAEFVNVRKEIVSEFGNVRKEIIEAKADNIKWMFIFWISQIAAILSIVLLFLRK